MADGGVLPPAVVHLVLQRGEERLGHGVIVAVAGAAAGKTHVVGPRPLVDPLPQMLGVGKRLAADEPPLQAVVGRLDHALSYGQPFSDRDLSMPKTSSISSIEETLANSLPRSV